MKRNMKLGMGALLTAMLLLSMAFVPAVSAKQGSGDVGILDVKNVGSLYTDADNNIASANGVGAVSVARGQNTFTVSYQNVNDVLLDGQGARFTITVWDAYGTPHANQVTLSQAGSGTLQVSFSTDRAGDGRYTILAESTDIPFDTVVASQSASGVVHYT